MLGRRVVVGGLAAGGVEVRRYRGAAVARSQDSADPCEQIRTAACKARVLSLTRYRVRTTRRRRPRRCVLRVSRHARRLAPRHRWRLGATSPMITCHAVASCGQRSMIASCRAPWSVRQSQLEILGVRLETRCVPQDASSPMFQRMSWMSGHCETSWVWPHRLSCRVAVGIRQVAVVVRQRCWQTGASGRVGDGYVSTKQRRRKGKNCSTVDPNTGSVYHRTEDQDGAVRVRGTATNGNEWEGIFRETEGRLGLGKRSADVSGRLGGGRRTRRRANISFRSIGNS